MVYLATSAYKAYPSGAHPQILDSDKNGLSVYLVIPAYKAYPSGALQDSILARKYYTRVTNNLA
jgi:hypothetical protein